MAKITLANGVVVEGTVEELKQMGVKFTVEEAEDEPLKVGDYAKVVKLGGHDNEIGDIVRITIVDETSFPYETEENAFRSDQLVRATDEEIAEVKWAEINRKPNEFKVGDAVRYKKAFTIVSEVKPDGIVAINQSNHISKNIEVNAEDLTLVFPAEAKFE